MYSLSKSVQIWNVFTETLIKIFLLQKFFSLTHQVADILGCRRRSSYPRQQVNCHLINFTTAISLAVTTWYQGFRCAGREGPPCVVQRGDSTAMYIRWKDSGHTNLTQVET